MEKGNENDILVAFIIFSLKAVSLMFMNPRYIKDYVGKYKNLAKNFLELSDYFRLYCTGFCEKLLKELYELILSFPENRLKEIEIEYTKLFRAAYPKVPCPPYESVYRSATRRVMKPFVVRSLEKIYREVGLEVDVEKVELPEHIVAELEALAYIISKASSNDLPTRFVSELYEKHISKWVPLFSQCIKENAKEPFYKNLAEILFSLDSCIGQMLEKFF